MRNTSEAAQGELTACRALRVLWRPVGGSNEQKALTEGCHSVIIIYEPFLL